MVGEFHLCVEIVLNELADELVDLVKVGVVDVYRVADDGEDGIGDASNGVKLASEDGFVILFLAVLVHGGEFFADFVDRSEPFPVKENFDEIVVLVSGEIHEAPFRGESLSLQGKVTTPWLGVQVFRSNVDIPVI